MKNSIFATGVAVFVISAGGALACSFGYGTQHNYDHDGTPDCASCTCAHYKPEAINPDDADLVSFDSKTEEGKGLNDTVEMAHFHSHGAETHSHSH